jgi:hypothetical protein
MLDFRKSLINSNLHKVLKRLHYPLEVMLVRARWYAAYPLIFHHLEEMMPERGVILAHVQEGSGSSAALLGARHQPAWLA